MKKNLVFFLTLFFASICIISAEETRQKAKESQLPKEIGKINNVSSGPDNGALNCTASCWWLAMRHASVEQAINNTLSRIPGIIVDQKNVKNITSDSDIVNGCYPVNIDGHGANGFLTMGSGQGPGQDYKTNIVAVWNKAWWGPHFAKLYGKCIPDLWIFSCHTGAGQEGADLLYEIAFIIGKPVHARTGLTYCGSGCVTFEPESVWQTATPANRPDPIDPPSTILYKRTNENIMKIKVKDEMISIPLNAVEEIDLTRTYMNNKIIEITFQKRECFDIGGDILYSDPFTPEGIPLSIITGKIKLKLKINNLIVQKEFEIHSNRLIKDVDYDLYYYLGSKFIYLLQSSKM